MGQYQIPPVKVPIDGPSAQQTSVFSPNEPDRAQWYPPRPDLQTIASPARFEGTPVVGADTYLFPSNQPLNRRSYCVVSRPATIAGRGPDRTSDLAALVLPQTPLRAYLEQAMARQQVWVPLREGGAAAPVEVPYLNLDSTRPIASWWPRSVEFCQPKVPLLGAPAAPTATDVFPMPWQPSRELPWRGQVKDWAPIDLTQTFLFLAPQDWPVYAPARPTPRLIIRQITGPTPPVPIIANPSGVFTQPADSWWTKAWQNFRVEIPAPPQLGATTQGTFLFLLDQPHRVAWYVPRWTQQTVPPDRAETPAQPLFLYKIDQPYHQITQRPVLVYPVPIGAASAAAPQSDDYFKFLQPSLYTDQRISNLTPWVPVPWEVLDVVISGPHALTGLSGLAGTWGDPAIGTWPGWWGPR